MSTIAVADQPAHPRPVDSAWDWRSDDQFVEKLTRDLRRQAVVRLRSGLRDISTSSLVQESLLRLLKAGCLRRTSDRASVYAIAYKAMRCLIVDHVRAKNALKRKARRIDSCLDLVAEALEQEQIDVLALHEALEELAKTDGRKATVVDLKFFGSFTMPEIADTLGIGLSTAESDWTTACQWLRRFMSR